jgi:hypothetical protein
MTSIASFLHGERTDAARVIPHNPFYSNLANRETAALTVMEFGLPVLRRSSIAGCYAITYLCPVRRTVVHSLLRQNADTSIDLLNDRGFVIERYASIYDLLLLVLGRMPSLFPPLAPPLRGSVPMPVPTAHPPGGEDPS